MLSGSIRLGRITGIPLMLHWSVGVVVFLVAANLLPTAGIIATVIGVLGFLGSILVHEMAHALVARRYGVQTLSVDLWALGGMARLDRDAPSPRADGWIAVAGPISSLALGLVFGGAALGLFAIGTTDAVVATLGWLAVINGVLAVFNMLPGAPLDGGRVVRAWRWGRHGDRFQAAREAATAGQVLGWGIAVVGVWLMFNGYSLIMLIVTGVFIAINAKAESLSASVQERLVGTRVRDLTWLGIAQATPETDTDTMLWQRGRLGQSGVVAVVGHDGQLSGLVTEERLEKVPETDRPFVTMGQLMVPFANLAQARLDEEVGDVLPRVNPSAPVVTVWEQGRLIGVVPAQRLRDRLTAASRSLSHAT